LISSEQEIRRLETELEKEKKINKNLQEEIKHLEKEIEVLESALNRKKKKEDWK